MADEPSPKTKDQNTEPPDPEVLKPKADTAPSAESSSTPKEPSTGKPSGYRRRARTYRPSHKGTFIGMAVVIAILAVNSIIIVFIVKHQNKNDQIDQNQVTISEGALDKLGVKSASVGDKGIELTVNPDSRFNGKVTIAGDTSVGGQLVLSKKLSAADASLTQLQAGNTSLSQLNVNGDGTLSSLSLRKDLNVAGNSRLQGAVVITNSVNISGSLSIGGQLSVNTLHVSSLVADSLIQIGGHTITSGLTPGISRGSGASSASVSGNDSAGTVFVGIGSGGGSGTLATVYFKNYYSGTPRVVITPVGRAANVYVTSSSGSFSIGGSGLSAGGYSFNYIIVQ